MLNGVVAHAPDLANDGGGFKPQYFSELARLEATNFWFRARNKIILWALRTYMPELQNFLEVGCGTGFVLSGIAEAHPEVALSGSEIFATGLSHATKRINSANFMQMDARHVPFVNEFDAIGVFDVLEHIEEDEAVLAQLHKALKPNGVLLLTVPQHPWLWSASDEYACHVRRYTRLEIEAKVRTCGFELLHSTSFVTTLLPAMMLSRELQKRNPGSSNPTDELKINPFFNKLFYSLMMLELFGIKLGLKYPVGGSRLIAARKV
ncbi:MULTISPECIES: trans-aconitate 2-methyltransferase [unclassified Pseudomonas]|uniref:class I SAM-dependent methyltransferase n=1 Tax=unclassified Pseudomonas TaxID=196821 RepID=UPI002115AD6B|nr:MULTISPECIES: class I SAM-dependent methyltransferase [unclassified Pseudomonas]